MCYYALFYLIKFDLFMILFSFIEDRVSLCLTESHHRYYICAAACPVCQIFFLLFAYASSRIFGSLIVSGKPVRKQLIKIYTI